MAAGTVERASLGQKPLKRARILLRKRLAFEAERSVTDSAGRKGAGISPRERGVLGSAATDRKA